MKLWITGANGFLGKALKNACLRKEIRCVSSSKEEADVSSLDQMTHFIKGQNITHIVNCAALAHVDLAEKFPETAFQVNVLGPQNLGIIARTMSIPLLHFSTEYIFNGNPSPKPFSEDDQPQPQGVYANTKREGELRLLEAFPEACIIRTSWLFGGRGKTFLSSLWHKILTEKELQIAADQKGRPTYIEDLIEAIFFLLNCQGIFHFANEGTISRYDIALFMKECAVEKEIAIACESLIPMASHAFLQMNQRPSSCILNTSKYESFIKTPIRSWKEAVKDHVLASKF